MPPLIMCVYVCVHACILSRVQVFATPWTVACQAPLSMKFSRQDCWSGLPFPSSGDLPNPGIEPPSLVSPTLAGRFFTSRVTREAQQLIICHIYFFINHLFLLLVTVLLFLCCCSVTKSCPTLCDPVDRSRPGSSVLHCLLESAQINVH